VKEASDLKKAKKEEDKVRLQQKRDQARAAASSGDAAAVGAVDMGALTADDMDMGDGLGKNYN